MTNYTYDPTHQCDYPWMHSDSSHGHEDYGANDVCNPAQIAELAADAEEQHQQHYPNQYPFGLPTQSTYQQHYAAQPASSYPYDYQSALASLPALVHSRQGSASTNSSFPVSLMGSRPGTLNPIQEAFYTLGGQSAGKEENQARKDDEQLSSSLGSMKIKPNNDFRTRRFGMAPEPATLSHVESGPESNSIIPDSALIPPVDTIDFSKVLQPQPVAGVHTMSDPLATQAVADWLNGPKGAAMPVDLELSLNQKNVTIQKPLKHSKPIITSNTRYIHERPSPAFGFSPSVGFDAQFKPIADADKKIAYTAGSWSEEEIRILLAVSAEYDRQFQQKYGKALMEPEAREAKWACIPEEIEKRLPTFRSPHMIRLFACAIGLKDSSPQYQSNVAKGKKRKVGVYVEGDGDGNEMYNGL